MSRLERFAKYIPKQIKDISSYQLITLLVLLLASTCTLAYKANTFYNRINNVRLADTDNLSWSVNQLEVEVYALSLAIEQKIIKDLTPSFAPDPLNEYDLVLWMDIVYSRADAVSSIVSSRTKNQNLLALLPELQQKKTHLASLVDSFDSNNAGHTYNIRKSVQELQALSREISLLSLNVFLGELAAQKNNEKEIFQRFFFFSILLLAVIIVTTFFILVLWTQFSRGTKLMRVALDNESRVFMSSPIGIAITEDTGDIRLVNPAFVTMFGEQSVNYNGKNIRDLVSNEENFSNENSNISKLFISEFSHSLDYTRVTAVRTDGSTFCAEISVAKNLDIDNNPIFVFMLRDVTLNLIAEDEIRAARDEAQKNALEKSNFLATMSHEMRTPLHCASAALDLVDIKSLDNEQRRLLDIAKLSSERAISEVNTVLDVSQSNGIERGLTDFSPRLVVEGIIQELQPLADQNNNNIHLNCFGEGSNLTYRGRLRAFSRVIYNLTSNAIKFTHQGDIEVTLHFSIHDGLVHKLDVEVKDEGIGIAPKDRERIFEEFVSLESEEFSRTANIGLGLPIARRAVASMGGALCLESKSGVGSSFSFSILLERSCKECLVRESDSPYLRLDEQNLNFLVVDDKELNRELLSKMVGQLGHNHATASNGLEAVSSACHRPYDVILIDDSMPVMGGREAVRHIRNGGPSKHSVIIGVTAYSDEERLSDFADAGADLVLIKPVKKQQLVEAFEYLRIRKIGSPDLEPSERYNFKTEAVDAFDMLSDALGPSKAFRLLDETLVDVKNQSEYLLDDLSSLDAIADRLHSVIGTTAFAGLEKLSSLLRTAEISARNGKRDDLKTHYDQISKCIKEELIAVKVMLEDVKDAKPDDTENMSSSRAG